MEREDWHRRLLRYLWDINDPNSPTRDRVFVIGYPVLVGLVALFWAYTKFWAHSGLPAKFEGALVAFGFALILGLVGSVLFVETIRKLFNWLLSYDDSNQGQTEDASLKQTMPRTMPIVIGVVERSLFTVLSIILLNPNMDGENNATALAVLCGGYVALRGFVRDRKTKDAPHTTIHALWGVGVSLGFAVAAGWLYWWVADPLAGVSKN